MRARFEYHCWECCTTAEERGEMGQPCVYPIRFDDGFEGHAWEDEIDLGIDR